MLPARGSAPRYKVAMTSAVSARATTRPIASTIHRLDVDGCGAVGCAFAGGWSGSAGGPAGRGAIETYAGIACIAKPAELCGGSETGPRARENDVISAFGEIGGCVGSASPLVRNGPDGRMGERSGRDGC